ncbi:MAG: hypothetical protein HYV02_05235 [Deltaproteobacteria bacterium]|nr:hypothetical protein [Deltaproteobacteria bacterium]
MPRPVSINPPVPAQLPRTVIPVQRRGHGTGTPPVADGPVAAVCGRRFPVADPQQVFDAIPRHWRSDAFPGLRPSEVVRRETALGVLVDHVADRLMAHGAGERAVQGVCYCFQMAGRLGWDTLTLRKRCDMLAAYFCADATAQHAPSAAQYFDARFWPGFGQTLWNHCRGADAFRDLPDAVIEEAMRRVAWGERAEQRLTQLRYRIERYLAHYQDRQRLLQTYMCDALTAEELALVRTIWAQRAQELFCELQDPLDRGWEHQLRAWACEIVSLKALCVQYGSAQAFFTIVSTLYHRWRDRVPVALLLREMTMIPRYRRVVEKEREGRHSIVGVAVDCLSTRITRRILAIEAFTGVHYGEPATRARARRFLLHATAQYPERMKGLPHLLPQWGAAFEARERGESLPAALAVIEERLGFGTVRDLLARIAADPRYHELDADFVQRVIARVDQQETSLRTASALRGRVYRYFDVYCERRRRVMALTRNLPVAARRAVRTEVLAAVRTHFLRAQSFVAVTDLWVRQTIDAVARARQQQARDLTQALRTQPTRAWQAVLFGSLLSEEAMAVWRDVLAHRRTRGSDAFPWSRLQSVVECTEATNPHSPGAWEAGLLTGLRNLVAGENGGHPEAGGPSVPLPVAIEQLRQRARAEGWTIDRLRSEIRFLSARVLQ